MPEYTYEALDSTGHATSGTISARDSADAAVKVRALGVYPTRIGGSKAGNGTTAAALRAGEAGKTAQAVVASPLSGLRSETEADGAGKKVPRLQVLLFTREMADLLDAGLPMDRAFSVLIDQTENAPLKAMMAVMQADIRAGQPLSEALRKFPREFPTLYANMVRAGEVSGQLASVMARLADFLEKEQVRRSQILAAMTYPMVLICVAALAVTFLLTYVIPKLANVFKDMGATLPLPTVILLGLSQGIVHYWWAIL